METEIVKTEYGDVLFENGEPVRVIAPEEGDPEQGGWLGDAGRFIGRHKVATALTLGGAGVGIYAANRAVHAARQKRREAARAAAANPPALEVLHYPFISGESIRFASTPLSGSSNQMPAVQLLNLIDRAMSNTPSAPVIVSAPSSGGTVEVLIGSGDLPALPSAVPPGQYANFFFPCFMVEIASSILTAQPAAPMLAATLNVPTEFAGLQNLLALGQLQIIPFSVNKRAAFLIIPWLIADSGPHPLMGLISAGSVLKLDVKFTGVPDGTTMTVTLPGSTHDLIHCLRRFLRTGQVVHRHAENQSNAILQLV